ncbi:MAG: ribbon-helix-helix protein, CopG family [Parcubacteria group bacterium]|nr:ribbon-helix-helix protein, CopG family [Parcubacteria group bacterium]
MKNQPRTHEKMVRIMLYIPEELNNKLRSLATRQGISKSELVRRLLTKILEGNSVE